MGTREATELLLTSGNSSCPDLVHGCASANCSEDGSFNPLEDALRSFSFASAPLTLWWKAWLAGRHNHTEIREGPRTVSLRLGAKQLMHATSYLLQSYLRLVLVVHKFLGLVIFILLLNIHVTMLCIKLDAWIILFSSFQILICSQKKVTLFKSRILY